MPGRTIRGLYNELMWHQYGAAVAYALPWHSDCYEQGKKSDMGVPLSDGAFIKDENAAAFESLNFPLPTNCNLVYSNSYLDSKFNIMF